MSPLLLYLEDAPLGPHVAGTGLSKAFNATLSGLVSDSTRVCVAQTHQYVAPSHFAQEWCAQPAWAAPQADWVLARVCARLPWPLARRTAALHGRWLAHRLRARMPGLLPAETRVLTPVGIDPLTLIRAEALSKALSAHFEPYLVDDLQHHPANAHLQDHLGKVLTDVLGRASRVYSITDGLGDILRQRHRVQARTLHLVASVTPGSQPAEEDLGAPMRISHFAFFLGSINHLYAEGLKQLIDLVGQMRQASGQDLTIRMSSASEQVQAELGQVPPWVIVGPIADHAELSRQIAGSTFCFLPYSFDDGARSMTETSFPSKMIDYLAYARGILVYGPESCVPVRLMVDNNLPLVASTVTTLNHCLQQLALAPVDHSPAYKQAIDRNFSPAAMRGALNLS